MVTNSVAEAAAMHTLLVQQLLTRSISRQHSHGFVGVSTKGSSLAMCTITLLCWSDPCADIAHGYPKWKL